MKVVVADDSKIFRERINNLLSSINNVVVVGEAENGLEALQLINDNHPEVIILDIRMPELNGIEVLKKIKEERKETKICMLTNYPYKQYKERCFKEGADYFFDKNLDIKQLKDVISKLANKLKGT